MFGLIQKQIVENTWAGAVFALQDRILIWNIVLKLYNSSAKLQGD